MESREIDVEMLCSLLPERPETAHKGSFGHVFIIAGSRGFTGAAKLACEAALRSGVGLVTVGIPKPLGDIMACSLIEAMSLVLPSTRTETLSSKALGPALKFSKNKQAVVLGPGLSQQTETCDFVLGFIEKCSVPLLIDADGLNCLSMQLRVLKRSKAPIVITPHPGEMARLTGLSTADIQNNREKVASDFAQEYGCVVVLKGHRTIVSGGHENVFINPTGNSGMASGGTGDVLSGLIGGLMAQGISTLDAALIGTYMHGLAGDFASAVMTERGMKAGDVIETIPEAWEIIESGELV